jgi:hypothetical protein
MGTVASSAILLAVFRLGSLAGLFALLPFGITAIIARLSGGPSAYRQALWVGAAGTLLLPFLAAIWINHQMWGYFLSRPAVDRRIVNARQIETFAGVRGGEVSNDHHPYYEFLFTTDSPGAAPKLLSSQRFYYDVAGMEGVEWPVLLPVFALYGLIPTIPLQGFLLWRARRRRRVQSDDPTRKTSTQESDPRGPDL